MNEAVPRKRDSRSSRRLTRGRRFVYTLAVPVGMAIIRFFWLTCRIVRVSGSQAFEARLFAGQPAIVCYWHRHQLMCWRYLNRLIGRGARIGWLISASVDGEVPTEIARRMGGGMVFRGSTTSGGTEALRAMRKAVVRDKFSIATTPDGPYGPHSQFKPGIVKLAQFSGAPLVPVAYAARRAWVLRTWDRFVIPKPFTRVVMAVGEPVTVPRTAGDEEVAAVQRQMEKALQALFESASREVHRGGSRPLTSGAGRR